MRFRMLTLPAIAFAAAMTIIPSMQVVHAQPDVPSCFDSERYIQVEATKWLTSPGTLTGTPGDDVLVGSEGSDIINGLGGNDLICTAPYGTFGTADQVNGGTGNDRIFGVGTLDGGSGNDRVFPFYAESYGKGGPGNDYVYVTNGGVGDGGSGNDELVGDNASSLLGGSGNDRVTNLTGNPRIDCGSGSDRVEANGAENVRNCETNRPL